MNTLHPIITRCAQCNIEVTIEWDELADCVYFLVEGFSKAGNAKLYFHDNGTVTAYTRYDQVDDINSFEELVNLAYEWWEKSCPKTWASPPQCWQQSFADFNLVHPTRETVTTWR